MLTLPLTKVEVASPRQRLLTIDLSGLLVSLEWKFLRTQDRQSETAAKFWTKLYAAVYAMSVATGITMEFQFGTDWVTYSRYVDDIFGDAPFPDLIHSSLNPDWNLTVHNAASSPKTLRIMLVIAVLGMPFVLAYTAVVYWVFRGKVQLGKFSY